MDKIFKDYLDHLKSDSIMVVHRHQQHLMYYSYLKRLSDENKRYCLGLSIVINDLETKNVKSLFRLFEKVLQHIILDEKVLSINSNGDIVSTDTPFSSLQSYFNRITEDIIKKAVNDGQEWFEQMAPLNFATSDDYTELWINSDEKTIINHLLRYNKIFIMKNSNSNGAALNGLLIKIQNLNNQLVFQKEYILKLEDKVRKSSTNWKIVSIVLSFIILILFFLFFIRGI